MYTSQLSQLLKRSLLDRYICDMQYRPLSATKHTLSRESIKPRNRSLKNIKNNKLVMSQYDSHILFVRVDLCHEQWYSYCGIGKRTYLRLESWSTLHTSLQLPRFMRTLSSGRVKIHCRSHLSCLQSSNTILPPIAIMAPIVPAASLLTRYFIDYNTSLNETHYLLSGV